MKLGLYPKWVKTPKGEILVMDEEGEKALLAKYKPKRTVKKKAVTRGTS